MLSLLASVFNGGGLTSGLDKARQITQGGGIREGGFTDSVVSTVNFALGFVALIAVVSFISSGFIFILGFGSDSSIQRARKIMIWSAVGIIVILFSFIITQFIVDFATAQ